MTFHRHRASTFEERSGEYMDRVPYRPALGYTGEWDESEWWELLALAVDAQRSVAAWNAEEVRTVVKLKARRARRMPSLAIAFWCEACGHAVTDDERAALRRRTSQFWHRLCGPCLPPLDA